MIQLMRRRFVEFRSYYQDKGSGHMPMEEAWKMGYQEGHKADPDAEFVVLGNQVPSTIPTWVRGTWSLAFNQAIQDARRS